MRWSRVCIEAINYVLPEERVASADLEARLEPLYKRYRLGMGQIESLTGVEERRFWPQEVSLSGAAAQAGRAALQASGVSVDDVGVLIYGGVCRENLEPATACAVAEQLGIGGEAVVMDHANACLSVLNGIVSVANMIEAEAVASSSSSGQLGPTHWVSQPPESTLDRRKTSATTRNLLRGSK